MIDILTSYWCLFLIVIAGGALAVGGLLLVRRFVDAPTLERHHDVAGHFLSIIGTLYAVVLGFIVVDSLNTYEKASITVAQEANAVHNLFHLSEGLDPEKRNQVQHLCLDYANAMIDHEWDAMQKSSISVEGHEAMNHLWKSVVIYQPKTTEQENLASAMLAEIDALDDARSDRQTGGAREYDPIVWSVLLIGAIVVVVFTYFFGLHNLKVQIVMTLMVTLVLSLNMVVVALFRYPYAGDVRVPDTAFVRDRNLFMEHFSEDP